LQHSSRDDLRFGRNGSKSVRPKDGIWFDHETDEGGGYWELYKRVHGERPADTTTEATYDYRDAKDVLLFQVVRKVPKTFRQRRPDGVGGWTWNMQGIERVPYRLPELLRADPSAPVFICEGEKDCNALHERGLIATTNPGGAGKWQPSMSDYLRDREVVILPDNDEAGENHANDVARKLFRIASSIKVVRLPGLPPKGDVSDWLAVGNSTEQLEQLVADTGPHEDHQGGADAEERDAPDMSVLRLARRSAPALPLDVFDPEWKAWIEHAAAGAACPPDYVAAPFLAFASALIGNARWARATEGWAEPPHLWCGAVGESGDGKSPGADALMRSVLPEVERRMSADFPEKLQAWKAASEMHAAKVESWKNDVREAQKKQHAPPLPPTGDPGPEPQAPRLCQHDVTIEKVATLLASAAPKGLLIVRDELAGWLLGMNQYHDAGRAFWIEAYGGRSYRVERQRSPEPIVVQHLAVAVTGGTQPDKLATLFRDADDGLLARFLWFWPEPLPFSLNRTAPDAAWAVEAFDRLRELDLAPPATPEERARPMMVPLATEALWDLEAFGREMQQCRDQAGGLMRSAYGKARGDVLRLSLVLEYLWWCAKPGMNPPPATISHRAFLAAATLVADYFMPMAERVYGDAAVPEADQNATTLARWIFRNRPEEVNVRHLQREVRLPGLRDAKAIHEACARLVEANWLFEPARGGAFGQRGKASYRVNPHLPEVVNEPVG
jgi:hypothetical protein